MILPELLDQGRRFVEHMLTPCGDDAVAQHLAPLMICQVRKNDEGLTVEQRGVVLAAELDVYQRLLRDLPSDLLEKACDDHAKRSKYFPAPAELRELAEAEFHKRQEWRRRIVRLQDEAKRPRSQAVVRETEEERLHGNIARWRRFGDKVLGVDLKGGAITAEKRLAEIEGRPAEEWALEEQAAPTAVLPPPPPPASKRHGPLARYAIDVPHEDVEPWQAGQPVYRPEEPPPPTEIAEAADLEP